MQRLKCELCGGLDIIKVADDIFQCQSCGCKYSLAQVKSIVVGSDKENSELERLLQNAATQIRFSEFIKADRLYDQISDEYPSEFVVWRDWLEGYYQWFACMIELPRDNLHQMKKVFSRALQTASTSERVSIQKKWDAFWKTYTQKLRNGEHSIFNNYLYLWHIEDHLKQVGSMHPELQQAIKDGFHGAKLLMGTDLWYGVATQDNESRWHFKTTSSHGDPYFILGKDCVYTYLGDGREYRFTRLKSTIQLTSDGIATLQLQAKTNWNNYVYCPYCNRELKNTLFGKRCVNDYCGKYRLRR
ncbi:MAG: hypothetical protein J1F23_08275 [Oscillospiraceae bacterium]|nr:hypothetical protein [Oscillospiraceae bacterium]